MCRQMRREDYSNAFKFNGIWYPAYVSYMFERAVPHTYDQIANQLAGTDFRDIFWLGSYDTNCLLWQPILGFAFPRRDLLGVAEQCHGRLFVIGRNYSQKRNEGTRSVAISQARIFCFTWFSHYGVDMDVFTFILTTCFEAQINLDRYEKKRWQLRVQLQMIRLGKHEYI